VKSIRWSWYHKSTFIIFLATHRGKGENVRPKREHPNKGWAATYGRVSEIRAGTVQDSPENQDRLTRQAAVLHGLKVKPGYEFSDHGVSASKDIPRRDVERGIKAVVDREVEALIVPAVDRLSRLGMRHLGEMLDAVEGADGRIIFVKEALDSSHPASRAIIAFLAEQARAEAGTLSWRIQVWHEGCRINGKWTTRRPYGHRVIDGKLVPHPDEAPIVRRIVAEVLNGQPIRGIATTLNSEGILAPDAAKAVEMRRDGREPKPGRGPRQGDNAPWVDAPWTARAIGRILRNPSLVGWQRHKDKVVLAPDGDPVSFGEGILQPGEHARVLAELERRTALVRKSSRREVGTRTGGGRPARYLLIGMARCKGCNYAINSQPASRKSVARYRCGSSKEGQPCPSRASLPMKLADAEVMRQVRIRLAAMEPGDPILDAIAERWRELAMPEDEGERAVLRSRLDAVRGRIVDLEEARYVRGQFTTPDDLARWDGMMTRLKVQRDAVLQELDELSPPADFDLTALRATYASEAWDATTLPQRRNLLRIAVAKVVIASAHNQLVPMCDLVKVFLVGEPEDA
jgi:site-specific DNA recombinase